MGTSITQQQRDAMVDGQLRTNKIIDPDILDVFLSVPREAFAPEGLSGAAYVDEDMDLGHGRTVLEPLVAARLLQAAELTAGQSALVIAGANGYLARLLVDLGLSVAVLEPVADLARPGEQLVPEAQWHIQPMTSLPDGFYDRIFVGGAIPAIPAKWRDRLAPQGRILAPLSGRVGNDGALVCAAATQTGLSSIMIANAAVPPLPEFRTPPVFTL